MSSIKSCDLSSAELLHKLCWPYSFDHDMALGCMNEHDNLASCGIAILIQCTISNVHARSCNNHSVIIINNFNDITCYFIHSNKIVEIWRHRMDRLAFDMACPMAAKFIAWTCFGQ